MSKLTYSEIEEWVDNVEELYWWGKDYCRENRCNVRAFIRENKSQILAIIKRHGG